MPKWLIQLTAGNCINHKKSNPLAHFWCMCNWPPKKKIENCWRSYPYNSITLFANYHTALTRGIQFACTYLDRRHPKNKHAIYRVFILKTEFYSTAKHYAINIAHIKQKLPHKMPCILLIASNLVAKKYIDYEKRLPSNGLYTCNSKCLLGHTPEPTNIWILCNEVASTHKRPVMQLDRLPW